MIYLSVLRYIKVYQQYYLAFTDLFFNVYLMYHILKTIYDSIISLLDVFIPAFAGV